MATTQIYPARAIQPTDMSAPFIRTLVVDDLPTMRLAVSGVLSEHPWIHVIGSERDGLSAIKAALAERPDLIVMDLNMPVMNGLKATMLLKQRLPDTRVILISSDDDPEVALAAMECGADAFIPKASLPTKRDWHIRRLFGDELLRRSSHRRDPLVLRISDGNCQFHPEGERE